MPKFKVEVTRRTSCVTIREAVATFEVDAEDAFAALEQVRAMEDDDNSPSFDDVDINQKFAPKDETETDEAAPIYNYAASSAED